MNIFKFLHARYDALEATAQTGYVRADIASKRAILNMHNAEGVRWEGRNADRETAYCTECTYNAPCPTVRLLAAPFAARADYDPSWGTT